MNVICMLKNKEASGGNNSSFCTVLRSWSRLELPLLVWSWQWSQFFCWPEPRAGAAFFQVAPAATFLPSKKESLVVVTKRDIRAIFYGKCDPK